MLVLLPSVPVGCFLIGQTFVFQMGNNNRATLSYSCFCFLFFLVGGGPSPSQSEHADSSGCMTEVIWTRRGLIGRYGGGQQHSSLQVCAQTQLRLIAGHAQLGKSVCGWLEQGGWGWISERQQQHVLVTGDGRR